MTVLGRRIGIGAAVLAVVCRRAGMAPAAAQENLDAGKTAGPALRLQLRDLPQERRTGCQRRAACSACRASCASITRPAAQVAAAMAAYRDAVDRGAPPAERRPKRAASRRKPANPATPKPARPRPKRKAAPPAEAKPADAEAEPARSRRSQAAEAKPATPQAGRAKPAEPRSTPASQRPTPPAGPNPIARQKPD